MSAGLKEVHGALVQREAEIDKAMQILIENSTSTHARLANLYLDVIQPMMASNVTAMKKEMNKVLESIAQDVAKPKELFYWNSSQAEKDAEKELQQALQIQERMQMVLEEFVQPNGQELLVNKVKKRSFNT
ncbi:MAG TPA: hypothetical protein PLD88_01070 [Candidatus Berkiella sp.]|nr:hypothetical protein [Candidatus Berkiella sp.]